MDNYQVEIPNNKTGEVFTFTPEQIEAIEAQFRAKQEAEAEERYQHKSPFKNFTQINDEVIPHLQTMALENPVAHALFLFLMKHMSKSNAVACAYEILEKAVGKSRPTVARAVKYLKDNGLVGVKKVGGTNLYHLNANAVWHSYGKNHRYAEVRGSILLSPQENPDLTVKEGRINHLQMTLDFDKS